VATTNNTLLRAYTVGIGVVCAGAVVLTLQAQHEADAAQRSARLSQQEAANWEASSIRALNERNRLAKQVNADVVRYNALVAQANGDKKKYAAAINDARAAAARGAATRYVSGGTVYRSAGGGTVVTSAPATSSGSSGGTSSSSSAPTTATS
jgi:hypothetical protein